MKFTKFFYLVILIVIAIFGTQSCQKSSTTEPMSEEIPAVDDGFATNTRDTIISNAVVIKYNGTTDTVTNPYQGNGVSVIVTNRIDRATPPFFSEKWYHYLWESSQ
jgi:hypothetical protein